MVVEQTGRNDLPDLPPDPSGIRLDSSQPSQTREEKTDLLNKLYRLPPEGTTTGSKPDDDGEYPISPPEDTLYTASQVGSVSYPRVAPTSRPSVEFLEVMRTHFLKPILEALRKIQPYAGSPSATVYANQILHKIRDLDEQSPDDPILEILFALYDALAFDGLWATYTASQYEEARQLLTRVVQEPIHPKNVEKALADLDSIGFDITPYPFLVEEDGVDKEEV